MRIADHPWHYRPDFVYRTGVLLPFDPTASVRQEIDATTGGFIGLLTRGRPVNDYYFTSRLTARGPRPTAKEVAEAAEDLAAAMKAGKPVELATGNERAVVARGTAPPRTPILSAVYQAACVLAQGESTVVEKDGRRAVASAVTANRKAALGAARAPYYPGGYLPPRMF